MDMLGLTSSDSDSEEEFIDLLDAACYILVTPKKRYNTLRGWNFIQQYDDD